MIELNNTEGAVSSYSGEMISILTPEENNYRIIDIAKGLAYKSHFGGQIPFYFSIAQHSVLVDVLYIRDCHMRKVTPDPVVRLACLLHDAPEAFLGDMLKPYKMLMPDYEFFENRMMQAMFDYFNLPILIMAEVKPFDKQAQNIEFDTFRRGEKDRIFTMTPDESLEEFMETYWEIINLIIEKKNVCIKSV